MMNRFLPFLFAIMFVTASGCEKPGALPTSVPNIVFILVDDLGWRDLGYAGSSYYETPNIDALAAGGMIFTDAYSNAPNCAPTRAALLSGQYAPRHGIYTVASAERGESRFRQLIPTPNTTELDTHFVTMAEALQSAGYTTAHFGKWHLGGGMHQPSNQGFDVSIPGWWGQKRSHFFPEDVEAGADWPGAVPGQYMADYLTDRAVEFIESNQETPFFLYLAHHGVHTPIEGKPDKIARYEQKTASAGHDNPVYAAMVESVDESVGRVVAKLDVLGLSENTLIVFFSDNGGYGPATDMLPLRGAKGMLYEGGIRVPMIVSWRGVVDAGAVSDTPVISIDFYPTFLEMAGGTPPNGYLLDGMSLAPVIYGENPLDREALYWHFPAYLEAYRDQKTPWRTTPAGAVRSGSYKLIEFFGEERIELYNLAEDAGETNNLVDSMPEKASELHEMLIAWRAETGAPVPQTPNPDFDEEAYLEALATE